MLKIFTSVVDRWIARRATVDPVAAEAVDGLTPAVVVTGGSRGIGRALASRFARAGHTVVIVARDSERLAAASAGLATETGAKIVPVVLDVTDADAPMALDDALRGAGLYADVLVNNAGEGLGGEFSEQQLGDIAHLIELNITAVTRLTHHALGAMVKRGRGGILNIASLGGFVPGPYQAAYYASKAYVVSLTEAVAWEARGRGVRIAVVAPGPVDTRFHAEMDADRALYRTVLPDLAPDAVAASAYRGYALGRTKIVPGLLPTVAALALKILPGMVTVPLVAVLLDNREQAAAKAPDSTGR